MLRKWVATPWITAPLALRARAAACQQRHTRGWADAMSQVQQDGPRYKVAAALHEALPPNRPTLVSQLSKHIPDELLDELDIGVKQLVEQYPTLFQLTLDRAAQLEVRPIPKARLLDKATVLRLQSILVENDGEMHIEILFRALSPEERAAIAPFRTLTAALTPLREDFVISPPTVSLPATKFHLVAERKCATLRPIFKLTPRYIVPLNVVAQVCGETPADAHARFTANPEYFDLVAPRNPPPVMEGLAADAYFAECFVRVLPPFHAFVDPTADALYDGHIAEDYDAYRLARFLTTDSDTSLSSLQSAAAVLTKPLLQVVLSFPEMFGFNEAQQSVRFLLRPDMRPSSMDQFSDEELEKKLEKLRIELKESRDRNRKFDRKHVKGKLDKLKQAKLIRSNPAGSVYMDPHVLGLLVYDCLPETEAIDVGRVNDTIPDHVCEGTHVKLNHWFFKHQPHLFYVFQIKPPSYMVQRADMPRDESVLVDENGRKFEELTAEECAVHVLKTAKAVQLQHSRPTRWATIAFRVPFELRNRIKILTWPVIIAARPDDIRQVTKGHDTKWLEFHGPQMEKELPPPSLEGEDGTPSSPSSESDREAPAKPAPRVPAQGVVAAEPALGTAPTSKGRGWDLGNAPAPADL